MTAIAVTPPRAPIKYIAELFRPENWSPTLANAPNNYIRFNNIYHFSIAPLIVDPDNYWIDIFGGFFDNPIQYGIQLYMDKFLTQVFLEDTLLAVDESFWVDDINNIVYMNIPKKPWQYFSEYAALYGNPGSTFSSAPKDETNLSDIRYGPVPAQPRLRVPSLNNKLSNIISGINVYNGFTIDIDNSDGRYDGFDILGYFNTPCVIRKSSEPVQTIQDFDPIRSGLVSDIQVGFDRFTIEARDQLYSLNTDFCNKFTVADYPNIDDSIINNDIRVGWGVLSKIKPIEVNRDTADPCTWIDYIALDPDYITACSAVYDDTGAALTFTFTAGTGIIRVTSVDVDGEAIEAESADVTGDTDNSIGEIIIKALTDKENKPYIAGIWDVTETNAYLAICSNVNFYFDGGMTRDLIEDVLKNDIAFLLQKNNGLLTLRRWGQEYTTHYIPEWLITKSPSKNFKDAYKYFLSTVKIEYLKNYNTDKFERTYIDDSMERAIFQRYRRSSTPTFESDLDGLTAVTDLGDRIMARFGEIRETLSFGVGVNTFEINLLDKIEISMEINDREFSPYSTWIVKECDPGQDVLVVEGDEINYVLTFDDVDAELDDDYLFSISGTGIN